MRNLALLTPRSEARAVGGTSARSRMSTAATCVSASIISTPGISGRARKVPLKELLADGDVLDRHEPDAGLVLGDGVEQERGIAVVDAIEERGKV